MIDHKKLAFGSSVVRLMPVDLLDPRVRPGRSIHLRVDEPVVRGQWRRRAGDALCQPVSTFGSSYHLVTYMTDQGLRLVTCARCKRLIERFQNEGHSHDHP